MTATLARRPRSGAPGHLRAPRQHPACDDHVDNDEAVALAAGAGHPLPRFGLPMTLSTCARESRNCRAMAAGFTPAS